MHFIVAQTNIIISLVQAAPSASSPGWASWPWWSWSTGQWRSAKIFSKETEEYIELWFLIQFHCVLSMNKRNIMLRTIYFIVSVSTTLPLGKYKLQKRYSFFVLPNSSSLFPSFDLHMWSLHSLHKWVMKLVWWLEWLECYNIDSKWHDFYVWVDVISKTYIYALNKTT